MADEAVQVIDKQAVELIAARVSASVRDELEALLSRVAQAEETAGMTVDQVAARLGVARSTVYAHWREWGGYKLGRGAKAPIRFDASRLPNPADQNRSTSAPPAARPARGRPRRRPLISDAPRLTQPLEEVA